MKDGVHLKADNLDDVVKAIHKLTSEDVLVGIPQANDARQDEDGSSITNAEIGYLMETGSPAMNLPARQSLVPGIQDVQKRIVGKLKKAASEALDGNAEEVDKALNEAGLIGQNGVRKKINDGDFAPLSEATLRARARRGRKGAIKELKSRAEGNAPNNANAKPLIDTGQYRNAVTYVIRRK